MKLGEQEKDVGVTEEFSTFHCDPMQDTSSLDPQDMDLKLVRT